VNDHEVALKSENQLPIYHPTKPERRALKAQKRQQQKRKGRRCKKCDKPLSIYNVDGTGKCAPCLLGEAQATEIDDMV
jgi:hypothetical protein